MRKSTIIAKCLVNADIVRDLAHAEWIVEHHFREEYPDADYSKWNRELEDEVGINIVAGVGRATTINVASFIRDLGDNQV